MITSLFVYGWLCRPIIYDMTCHVVWSHRPDQCTAIVDSRTLDISSKLLGAWTSMTGLWTWWQYWWARLWWAEKV